MAKAIAGDTLEHLRRCYPELRVCVSLGQHGDDRNYQIMTFEGSRDELLLSRIATEALFEGTSRLTEFGEYTYVIRRYKGDEYQGDNEVVSIHTSIDPEPDEDHKEVAHLTYARLDVTPEAKGWNVGAIFGSLEELIERFIREATIPGAPA